MGKAKIISSMNKKGGVGKSTTVSALGSICAHYGMRVLIVDLDPQINSTALFLKSTPQKTVTDIFKKNESEITYKFIKSVIVHTEYPNVDIIPGDENLDEEGDIILLQNAIVTGRNKIEIKKSAQMLLTKAFDLIDKDYDLILIDNTPYFNLISKNALSASNGVLIPVQSDGFSYSGLTRLLEKIYEIKSDLNNKLDIIGVYFSGVNDRTTVYRQLKELFKKDLRNKLLDISIRRDNAVIESNTHYIPLYNYAPRSNATIDYMFMVMELHLLDQENHSRLVKDLDIYLKNRYEREAK